MKCSTEKENHNQATAFNSIRLIWNEWSVRGARVSVYMAIYFFYWRDDGWAMGN